MSIEVHGLCEALAMTYTSAALPTGGAIVIAQRTDDDIGLVGYREGSREVSCARLGRRRHGRKHLRTRPAGEDLDRQWLTQSYETEARSSEKTAEAVGERGLLFGRGGELRTVQCRSCSAV